MKQNINLLVISISLAITSCATSKKAKEFVLFNTLSSEQVESITNICVDNQMDSASSKMIPVRGFGRSLKEKLDHSQFDTSMKAINYPIKIYMDSFFNFNSNCKSTQRFSLKAIRTYADHTSYGMGTFSVNYKIEAVLQTSDFIDLNYAGISKSQNLGMFSSDEKSIKYQSEALTSAFHQLYTNICEEIACK